MCTVQCAVLELEPGVVLSGNQLLEVWRVEDDWSSPSTGWLAGASPRAVSCGLARRKVSFRLQKILKTRREICCHPLINSPKKRPRAPKSVEDDKLRKGNAVRLNLTDSKILPELTGGSQLVCDTSQTVRLFIKPG